MEAKKQLCKIPDFVEFDYYPEQELHAFINIQNLTDEIVSFKIKTTAPVEYLVKPMEGQIYSMQKAKVVFKRKKLSLENFQVIQNGTKPFKEKFMFIITCKYKNAIGIQKVEETSHIMNVKFSNPKKVFPNLPESDVKKVKKIKTPEQKRQQNELMALIQAGKQKLEQLKRQRQEHEERLEMMQKPTNELSQSGENMTQTKVVSANQLSLQQIICLIVLSLFLGLWL